MCSAVKFNRSHKVPKQVSCERLCRLPSLHTMLPTHIQNLVKLYQLIYLKESSTQFPPSLLLNVTVACKTFYLVQKSTLMTAITSCPVMKVSSGRSWAVGRTRLNASVGREALHSTIVHCRERVQWWEEWVLQRNSCSITEEREWMRWLHKFLFYALFQRCTVCLLTYRCGGGSHHCSGLILFFMLHSKLLVCFKNTIGNTARCARCSVYNNTMLSWD